MKPDSVEFIYEPYGYRSANWDREKCRAMAAEYNDLKDIDMVIAAGPWVIQDLIAASFDRPIIGVYQFDPEVTDLVDSLGHPVVNNLTVTYSPDKLKNDMATMLRLFPAKKIGLMYFPSGDEFNGFVEKIKAIAEEYDVKVFASEKYNDYGVYSFFAAFHAIREDIDVLYVPPLWGMELDQIRYLFQETQFAKVPTFAAEGYNMLEKGATASDCIRPYRPAAKFTASKMLDIVNGARPASLPTRFEDVRAMSLNVEGARKINIVFDKSLIFNAKVIPATPDENSPRYTLAQAMAQGLRENSGFLAKSEFYNKVLAEAKKAYASYLPSLNLGLSAATTDNSERAAVYNEILNQEYSADVILDQKLFSYPAIKAIKIASQKSQLENLSLEQSRLELQYAIFTAYLEILECEERVESYSTSVDRIRDYWEIAVANYQLGLADTLDIALLEERLVTQKIKFQDVNNELAAARIVFNILVNRPGDQEIVLDHSEFEPERMVLLARKFDEYTSTDKKQREFENFLMNRGVGNSYDLKKASLAIGIQKDLMKLNSRRYLPELNLRLKYSHGNLFEPITGDRKDSWTFGGYLSFPIFSDPGKLYEGKMMKSDLGRLQYEKDDIRFHLLQEITTRAGYFATRVATLPMNYFNRNLSVSNLDQAFVKYNKGKYSIIDLIALEKEASERSLDLVADKYGFFGSYAGLLKASGTGYLLRGSKEETRFMGDLDAYMSE